LHNQIEGYEKRAKNASMDEQTVVALHWLGIVDYEIAWQLQQRLALEIAEGWRKPTLLLLEHPHVYTIGRRGQAANLLWDDAERQRRGISLHQVDRGGDVTYHGPGQLVGYPLMRLAPNGWSGKRLPQADYVGYVRRLEETIIMALARLGLVAGQRSGLTGVWVMADVMGRCLRCDPDQKPAPGKIASIGVKVDVNGISRHGFALNVATDPAYWAGIVPCGLEQVTMVNLADLLHPVPLMDAVRTALETAFAEVFGVRMARMDRFALE
jgi:lipoate-protein ligase B